MIEGAPLFRRGQRLQAALGDPLFQTQGPKGIPHPYGVLAQQPADEDGLWELLWQFQKLLAEKAIVKIFRQAENLPGDDTSQRGIFYFQRFPLPGKGRHLPGVQRFCFLRECSPEPGRHFAPAGGDERLFFSGEKRGQPYHIHLGRKGFQTLH